jgi:dUTP pyrophosphatase
LSVNVNIELCRKTARLPEYANLYDAGMDVYAADEILIGPGETKIVPTGLKFAIPEGYEIQVRPRSGLSLRTALRISNSPGTIDAGYRDEFGIIITNTTPVCCFSSDEPVTIDNKEENQGLYKIRIGDRIAQIVLQQVPRMSFNIVKNVKDIGSDRGGGFGSTGV